MHTNPKSMRTTLPRHITAQQVRNALEEGREIIAHRHRLVTIPTPAGPRRRRTTAEAWELIEAERIDREAGQ